MSTTPSLSAMSSMMSMTMKQPVRPAPALQTESQSERSLFLIEGFINEYLGMHFVICGRTCIVGYHKGMHVFSYLQWTTIGPAEGGLEILTLRMKESSPVAWYGTPWSGQPVKWNCLTSRTSLKPRWVEIEHISKLHFTVPVNFILGLLIKFNSKLWTS